MNKSYYLENCYEVHLKYPRTFPIPSRKDIFRLQENDIVKLIFVIKNPTNSGPSAERMWVRITNIFDYDIEEKKGEIVSKVKKRKFSGKLDDNPYFIDDIHYDDLIDFDDSNICTTELPYENTININDFCLISKDALKQKNSEIAVRYSSPQFENDSGWRFYVGTEAELDLFLGIINVDEIKKIEVDTEMVKMTIHEAFNEVGLIERVIEEEEGIFRFSETKGDFEKLKSFSSY